MNQTISREPGVSGDHKTVLLCFSHLRWDLVLQRPQHLMERATRRYRVFYIEEPVHAPEPSHFRMRFERSGVTVLTPVFEAGRDAVREQELLVSGLLDRLRANRVVQWYYTPMALRFTAGLRCDLTVYDCMDELAAFRFAPPDLRDLERRLMARADLVFTGGASLYAAKRDLHHDLHCFPSSVDVAHFGRAKRGAPDPADQTEIGRPRVGYFGVIDERMDLGLVARTAALLPEVQFVMLGPVVKIDPCDLPRGANLHWLGRKDYAELPDYLANWQAGWMPFALNEATRFISPTKTPEFLAAGLQVVSTAITDVVADWGSAGLVRIADADGMAAAIEASLAAPAAGWRVRVDARLDAMSWDRTWAAMSERMEAKQRLPVLV